MNEKGSGCLVEIKGVTLHFGAKMIFNDLSLEIRRGECLVLLGPSGIGKSTLLRLLIKTLNPERGSILFHGADITHLTRTQLNRIRTQNRNGFSIVRARQFHVRLRESRVASEGVNDKNRAGDSDNC